MPLRILVAVLLAAAGSALLVASADAQVRPIVALEVVDRTIDYDDGAFTLSVALNRFDHHGRIGYDDDRDGEPDRFEPSTGLGGYDILIDYDPRIVDLVDLSAGQMLRSGGRNAQCVSRVLEPGLYAIGCFSQGGGAGPQGGGTLATMRFQPIARGEMTFRIIASLAGPLGDEIDVWAQPLDITVRGGPAPGPMPPGVREERYRPPSVIGDGELGNLGEDGNGSRWGGSLLRDTDGDGRPDSVVDDANDPRGGPRAGTGYQPRDATPVPLIAGGALAAGGAVLLLAGTQLATRRR